MNARCCAFFFPCIWGHVLSPLIGGSASVNVMSGVLIPSTTLPAALFASSLCVTLVCDLTLPICVCSPRLSLVWMMSSASCRSSLWGSCWKQSGSMAYLRIVLMMKALSDSIESVFVLIGFER